jgi:hypothetical protein
MEKTKSAKTEAKSGKEKMSKKDSKRVQKEVLTECPNFPMLD